MKTTLIPLIGDPNENLYQLGLKERESYKILEEKVSTLLSTNNFFRFGQDILHKAKELLKKSDDTFFDTCIQSYADGLGINASSYKSFISTFELAAHYGQIYPELKGLIPGCTSLLEKTSDGFIHNRLFDFPLIDTFNLNPRLYYWKVEGKPAILNYSCEGLAPLFFQAIHDGGFSVAIHHKPGNKFHSEGSSIFKIAFNGLFEVPNMNEFRRDLRKRISNTKWGFYMMDQNGSVVCSDIDGPSMNFETFNLNETSPLIFTNIPLQKGSEGSDQFLKFCQSREMWLREKLSKNRTGHSLDLLTDIKDQRVRKWVHPSSTLSTVGACQINLSKGYVHVKEGEGALTASDAILEFSLQQIGLGKIFKSAEIPSTFEMSWKHASKAQSFYDQGDWDKAYHHLQMAEAMAPHSVWREIFKFYLSVWNFQNISNKKELALVYREVKKMNLPDMMRDQWLFLCMRLEKKLDLVLTIKPTELSEQLRGDFSKEVDAPLAIFNTWMKLIYPRLEILNIFSPHHK